MHVIEETILLSSSYVWTSIHHTKIKWRKCPLLSKVQSNSFAIGVLQFGIWDFFWIMPMWRVLKRAILLIIINTLITPLTGQIQWIYVKRRIKFRLTELLKNASMSLSFTHDRVGWSKLIKVMIKLKGEFSHALLFSSIWLVILRFFGQLARKKKKFIKRFFFFIFTWKCLVKIVKITNYLDLQNFRSVRIALWRHEAVI